MGGAFVTACGLHVLVVGCCCLQVLEDVLALHQFTTYVLAPCMLGFFVLLGLSPPKTVPADAAVTGRTIPRPWHTLAAFLLLFAADVVGA